VVVTPISKFLARSKDAQGRPKVLVGRVTGHARQQIPQAVDYALRQVGKPYDKVFLMSEDAFYCSDLVYYAYRPAGIFELKPMTFKRPGSQEFYPAWVDYYRQLGAAIPEGQQGINPGAISRARAVEIVYVFGEVSRN
jgi:hypothetical protein